MAEVGNDFDIAITTGMVEIEPDVADSSELEIPSCPVPHINIEEHPSLSGESQLDAPQPLARRGKLAPREPQLGWWGSGLNWLHVHVAELAGSLLGALMGTRRRDDREVTGWVSSWQFDTRTWYYDWKARERREAQRREMHAAELSAGQQQGAAAVAPRTDAAAPSPIHGVPPGRRKLLREIEDRLADKLAEEAEAERSRRHEEADQRLDESLATRDLITEDPLDPESSSR